MIKTFRESPHCKAPKRPGECGGGEWGIVLLFQGVYNRGMNGTDFRIFYEQYAIYRLAEYLKIEPKLIKHLSKENVISPHDLEYNHLKFDVKYSHPVLTSRKKKAMYWDFNMRKQSNGNRRGHDGTYCDFFVLIGMKNGIPQSVYLVPMSSAPTNHIRISVKGESKYSKYLI